MADIFISYSKGYQAQTEQLARELRAKGFSVWYDTSLVPGDSFRDVIISELAQARAAIVIWNAASVKSEWVCSEASRARARRILIPVRTDDIRSHDIPPPFDGLHTELLSNRSAIEAALTKLGVLATLPIEDNSSASSGLQHDSTRPTPMLPNKPSIAVLPFRSMSTDSALEYFTDGIAEDILTTLSKIHELVVIAGNSSFAFKGQARDIREIGRILGVHYVLEGSVRKAGNRVRLTAQLIDSLNGGNVWADHFEGNLDDVFELQDRITHDIVAALEVRLTFGEEMRVWRKRSGSPLVYEHVQKGRVLYTNFAKHTHAQARSELERALAIDPNCTPALMMLGLTLTDQARFGWKKDEATSYEAALECAARALAVDPNSAEAYVTLGYARLFQRRHVEAVAAGETAVALCPNSANAYHMAGMFHGFDGDFRKAAQYETQVQRLAPLGRNESRIDEARARFHLGDLTAARDIASRILVERPHWLTAQAVLAASLWNLGSEDEARATVKTMMANHPNLTASRWAQGFPYRYQKDLDAYVTPLRLAGLPK
jgi:TolB-like protein